MSTTIKTLTVDGVTKRISEWASDCGISATALHGRLERGWDVADAVSLPADRFVVSKSEAELALNEMNREELPKQLLKVLPEDYRGYKCGEYLRNNFRRQWDHWFLTVYVPNHSKKQVPCKEKSTTTQPAS